MVTPQAIAGLVLLALGVQSATFQLSNTLGDHMVLQRDAVAPPAVVWGFAQPGAAVYTSFMGKRFQTEAGTDGVWRQALPTTPAGGPYDILFHTDSGETAALNDVLFGGKQHKSAFTLLK